MRKFGGVLLLVLALVTGRGENAATAGKPAKKARVLFLTQSKGYRHGSVTRRGDKLSPAEIAITQLGQQSGLFEVHCTQDAAADFTPDNLKNYDIVMFYTSGVLPISKKARDYFLNDWLKQKGHGFIGFHSASDTYRSAKNNPKQNEEFRWYWNMVGGTFNGHPWTARTTVTIAVHDPDFPAMKPFGREFQIRDEIYQYRNWQPEKVRVLMSLNMAKCKPQRPSAGFWGWSQAMPLPTRPFRRPKKPKPAPLSGSEQIGVEFARAGFRIEIEAFVFAGQIHQPLQGRSSFRQCTFRLPQWPVACNPPGCI